MHGAVTQSFRLRWRPELRFYEQRVAILRGLQDRGMLEAFRIDDETAGAQLPGWQWISFWASGITVNMLTGEDASNDPWPIVEQVCDALGPLEFVRARASYQHVFELPFTFEEAVARGHASLYRKLSSPEVELGDWALLTDIRAAGPPQSAGMVEFGIVRRAELQQRLGQGVGRGPGMAHIGEREWDLAAFKEVSLFADSDLTIAVEPGREDAFLPDAAVFWSTSREQMTRLVEGLGRKLVEDRDGGE